MKTKHIITFLSLLLSVGGASQAIYQLVDQQVVVENQDMCLTHIEEPIVNSTINITSANSFLIFENIRPAVVIEKYMESILVDGQEAKLDENARVCTYRHGTVVMANIANLKPLVIYSLPNFSGDSMQLDLNVYHTDLKEFDNKVASFRLKRGYSMTLANEPDGLGYSRFFVAEFADLNEASMPVELSNSISFARVFPWEYPSKKGWCDVSGTVRGEKLDATWFYSWGVGYKTTPNQQYVPGKEQKYWPSWSTISGLTGFSHLYTYTEPDNELYPDRMVSVDEAIQAWPNLLKVGMRLGAPAAMKLPYVYDFIRKADSLNYRVDYVVLHCYWAAKTPTQWYNDLKKVHEITKRPLWIKEWNNGATWTNEAWPTSFTKQLEKQEKELKAILNVLDTAHFVERYSIYNWVAEKRAMILDKSDAAYEKDIAKTDSLISVETDATKLAELQKKMASQKQLYNDVKTYRDQYGDLTPAGVFYKNNKPDFAYRNINEVVPTYTAIEPKLQSGINNDSIRFSWENENRELTLKIILQRKNAMGLYERVKEITQNNIALINIAKENLSSGSSVYRLMLQDKTGGFVYSNEIEVYISDTKEETLEYGKMDVLSNNWMTVGLNDNRAASPIFISGSPTFNNKTMPFTISIDSLSKNGCMFKLSPWKYLNSEFSVPENISFCALDKGAANVGGLKSLADVVNFVGLTWKKVTFKTPFNTIPVVFATPATSKTNIPVSVKIRNITTNGFEIALGKEKTVYGAPMENVNYLAIEQGEGLLGNKNMLVGLNNIESDSISVNNISDKTLLFAQTQSSNNTIAYKTHHKIGDNKVSFLNIFEQSQELPETSKELLGWMIIGENISKSGIEKSSIPSTYIYPNPAQDYLYLNTPDRNVTEVVIYYLNGDKESVKVVDNSVNISHLSNGLLFIKIGKQLHPFIKK